LPVTDLGAPIDVFWMRLSRRDTDPPQSFGHLGNGHVVVTLDRGDYWQCAYVISKGEAQKLRTGDVDVVRRAIADLVPWLRDRVAELRTWDDLSLLTVKVDRLEQWSKPGLLCIGDAAHAMSPIGGVGINLAVQDAVAAANRLAAPLRAGRLGPHDLEAVQRRRAWPARMTQRIQLTLQDRVVRPLLRSTRKPTPPRLLRLIGAVPMLQRIPGRLLAVGFRPEHVHTPDVTAAGGRG
jgi:2-polyprenyl-6-methoxyphenol hydroxylase-like FAD-dependent oxidoreductase